MNRPLKFRAWDKHEQRFVSTNYDAEPFEIYLDGSYLGLAVGPDWGGEERYTITQWTGLLDSEGTEIYEGDVVAHELIVSPGALIQWDGVNGCWSLGEGWPISEFYDSIDTVKVISNIYESPDLLEEG